MYQNLNVISEKRNDVRSGNISAADSKIILILILQNQLTHCFF